VVPTTYKMPVIELQNIKHVKVYVNGIQTLFVTTKYVK
jgi:hypothetical protein